MPLTTIQTAFVAGEISPELFGRVDLAKYHQGASTMRNFFVNYRGGAASRAGTAYVGMCKQPGTAAAPRDIPFQFSLTQGYALEFGDNYMRVKFQGAYVTEAQNAITGITQAVPGVFSYANTNYTLANGDWIYVTGVGGIANFNGLTWIVESVSGDNFTVTDLFGNPVDTTAFPAYTSGGMLARIFTQATPYAAVDLPYLKFTQSADTMTLVCVNTTTSTEYAPYELKRLGATDWTLTQDSFGASIGAPTGVTVTAQSSTTVSTWYSYVVTAVDAQTGEESVASVSAGVENNDIAVYAGSNTITWNPVDGAGSYNVYKATPSYGAGVPVGVLYGYAGSSLGPTFTDTNITADFTTVPPVHTDPFARGAIVSVAVSAQGASYTQATVGYTVNSSTGSGFVGSPIIIGGKLAAFLVVTGGANYKSGDSITITDSGSGSGATVTLTIGPASGTYPSTVAYYQQRRFYGSSLNNPDTYWATQPGAFLNMDSSTPVSDADAIVGTPWAQQVNGLQFLVPMPGGLVVLTGKGAWQLNGGNSAAITPADQDANPQAYNGCNNIVPPITINYDILYVQSKGSVVRDLSYNFFVNIYTGTDMTVLSSQLFTNRTILQWAWAEEPYKLVWAVRDDGIMLSLTYLKEQDVYAWTRHDTNGLFIGVCSITEPPVDALYLIVKRFVNGRWNYYSERMNDRTWESVEECWCVDCGLAYPMGYPDATLTPAAANGTQNISGTIVIVGGVNYTNPTIRAVDPTNAGSGATFSTTVVGGVITEIVPVTTGQNYAGGTQLVITDATGSGAVAQPIITNEIDFKASGAVFSSETVGSVIRVGGGVANVTNYISPTEVVADIVEPITVTVPNDPSNTPVPAASGDWTLTAPTTVVSGLNHLEGLTVAILADGSVLPNQTVANGSVTLPQPYSAIIVGLPFTAQLQTLYLDPPGQPTTPQSRRKNIYSLAVRASASRGMQCGANQPDASTQPSAATIPWTNMKKLKERSATVHAGRSIPLFTGDSFINIPANWDSKGQLAIQQTYPLPANILGCVAYYQVGDTPG